MALDDRLDSQHAAAFLSAAVALARSPVHTPTWTAQVLSTLEATYAERPLLHAPTLVLDLAVLLQGERLSPVHPTVSQPVREALRAYEDHVLARLTADRRWTRVAEGVVAAPKELKATAVAMVVTQVLTRLGVEGGTGVSQAVVRRLATSPVSELLDQGRLALEDPELAARIAEGFHVLARAARRTREVLSDAEVFVVENIASLKSLGARVALTQLATAAQLVEERLPARLRGHVFEDGDAPTSLEEDSAYPVGGFSSIATVGSLENLVTSELIYMDDEGASRPDLFDVRFVEGELLYYARDESVAVRKRRRVVFVFDPTLSGARVLDPRAGFQRLVWLLGAVTALVRKMADWFDTEALTFELVFVRGKAAPLTEEFGVASLVLREFRERGQVELREAETTAQACREAKETWRQRARVLVFGTQFPQGLDESNQPDAWVSLKSGRPDIAWKAGPVPVPEDTAAAADVWAVLSKALLDGLLAPSRRK
ncbi:MAG: hypothetical protein JNJ54_32550 [Myxococcaceae bacterium]|nr:hypothetical protein [Myxococcaceae bacterium]